MTCSEVQRVLPELLDDVPEGAFPTAFADYAFADDAFADHVKSCPVCSDLVSDLKLIASEARQLAASDEPAPRVWVQVAGGQLRDDPVARRSQSFSIDR